MVLNPNTYKFQGRYRYEWLHGVRETSRGSRSPVGHGTAAYLRFTVQLCCRDVDLCCRESCSAFATHENRCLGIHFLHETF